jgi:hypothetical protein
MDFIKKLRLKKIFEVFLLSFLASLCMELLIFLFQFLELQDTMNSLPWTFYWVWIFVAFLFINLIIRRFQIKFENFISITIFGSFIVWALSITFPNYVTVKNYNFYGVEFRKNLNYSIGDLYNETKIFDEPLQKSFLFSVNDLAMMEEYNEKKSENESVKLIGFMFWQAGLAYGFMPQNINEFNGADNNDKRIELYFTVGPMVIAECLLVGVRKNLIIFFLFQALYFLYQGEDIWRFNFF